MQNSIFVSTLVQTLKLITMKKFIVAGLMLTASTFGFSQTYAEVEKPSNEENPFSMEVLFFNGEDGLNWQEPTLRFRYFVQDNIAARLQFGLGDGLGTPMNEKNRFSEEPDGSGEEGVQEISRMSWNVQVGGEYHFLGTKKFSPYGYLGLNLGGGSLTETWDQTNGNEYVENLTGEITAGFSRFGFSGGLGMEFYAVENIFIGLELGIGYNSVSFNDTEVTTTVVTPGGSLVNNQTVLRGSEAYLGTHAALRIGWRF